MFFILSKLLNVLLSPLVWVVVIFLLAFFLKRSARLKVLFAGFLLLLIFSNNALFNGIARWWEVRPIKAEAMSNTHDKIVVLGGMATENMYNGLPRFAQSSDRLWQGLWLFKQDFAETLIISGGLGNLFDEQKPEAELLKGYLNDIGIMNKRLFFESTSRNTFENARNTADLFEERKWNKSIILVTSGFHVPRAQKCFEKQGFNVTVFPADPMSSIRPLQWKDYMIPSAGALVGWGVLFREWAGMAMYWLNGYI